jgi:hypothetical protein
MQTTRSRSVKAAALTHGNVVWHRGDKKTVAAIELGHRATGGQYADVDFTDGSFARFGANDDIRLAWVA